MSAPICALCGKQVASYVCQTCGRTVCGNCLNSTTWTCSACTSSANTETSTSSLTHFSLLSILMFLGTAAIFIGMLLLVLGSVSNLSQGTSGSAVILIGPIPIILGSGPNSFALVAIGAVLTVVMVAFFLILRKKRFFL